MDRIDKTIEIINDFYDSHSEDEVNNLFDEIRRGNYDSPTMEEYLALFDDFKVN